MHRLNHPVYRNRTLQVAADALLVAVAFFLAFRLRFLDDAGGIPDRYQTLLWSSRSRFVALGKVIVFAAFGLYQKWWRYVTGRDFLDILRAVAVSSAILVVVFTVVKPFDDNLPRSVAVMDFMLTLMLLAGARLAVRLIVERPSRGTRIPRGSEVLVVGAGSGGQMVVRELQLNPNLGKTAIGFVDDDPRKRGMRMLGPEGARLDRRDRRDPRRDRARRGRDRDSLGARHAAGARSSPPAASARSASAPCRPSSSCCAGASSSTSSCARSRSRTCSAATRSCVELDRVGAYLEDRIVLVTGAGGSIGSELCRQIARVGPRLLVMLDHAEDNLFQIDREMVEERHFTSVESVLADCKEPDRMLEVMQRFKPQRRLPRRRLQARAADGGQPARGGPQQRDRDPDHGRDRGGLARPSASSSSRPTRRSTRKTVMGASKAMAEWIVEAAGHPPSPHALRQRALRQRARLVGQRRADLPQPDRARRAGHRHPPGDDPLLHDHPGGGPAGDPCRRHRLRQGRGLRPRHGRAGADRRPCPQHDPPRRL